MPCPDLRGGKQGPGLAPRPQRTQPRPSIQATPSNGPSGGPTCWLPEAPVLSQHPENVTETRTHRRLHSCPRSSPRTRTARPVRCVWRRLRRPRWPACCPGAGSPSAHTGRSSWTLRGGGARGQSPRGRRPDPAPCCSDDTLGNKTRQRRCLPTPQPRLGRATAEHGPLLSPARARGARRCPGVPGAALSAWSDPERGEHRGALLPPGLPVSGGDIHFRNSVHL